MIYDLYEYRRLMLLLIYRDLKARYAGSVLGALWNLIHPITMIIIYIVIIGQIIVAKREAVAGEDAMAITIGAYAIHLVAGMIPWLLFSEIVSRSSTTLLENANFLSKLAFPAVILPISVFTHALLLYSMASIFFIGCIGLLGHDLPSTTLLYFVILLGIAVVALGIGMMAAIITVYLRDFGQFLQIALQLGMWLMPIVYFREDVPVFFQHIIDLNPLSYFIRAAQAMVMDTEGPSRHHLPHMVLFAFTALVLGYRFFQVNRRRVLDEL